MSTNDKIFSILEAINTIRTNYELPILSKYEFSTPAEWRREHKRVMESFRANICPWN